MDPKSLGLREKKEVPVSKGIKMKRLHWDPIAITTVKGSIWENLDESKIVYDRKHFELHFQVRQRNPVDEQKAATHFGLYNFQNLHLRLKFWIFKQNFEEICDSLLDQYKVLARACDKVCAVCVAVFSCFHQKVARLQLF